MPRMRLACTLCLCQMPVEPMHGGALFKSPTAMLARDGPRCGPTRARCVEFLFCRCV